MSLPPHRHWLPLVVMALLATLLAAPVAAQTPCDSHEGRLADLHSRAQLKRFVHCAGAHVATVGWQQAAQDFETDLWLDGSIYLFAGTLQGEVIFVSGLDIPAGADMWHRADSDGVFSAREIARIAAGFGEGYVYYRFENPLSGQEEPKVAYVIRMEHGGRPAFIGAAIYPQDTHATCSPDLVRASLVYVERDVERFVTCAEHHLQQNGLRALHDFNNGPRWTSGPTYLFLLDMETLRRVAHGGNPALVGTDSETWIDPDGVHVAREMRRVLSAHDDGYVYYRRLNPANGEVEPKTSYIRRVLLDGRAYLLGAGLYVPAVECRQLPLAREIDTRAELQQYVRCAAQLVAERGELAFDLFLNHPQWIGGSAYVFVQDELCRQLVYPLDYERAVSDEPRCDLRDAEGTLLNQDLLDMSRSEAGEGWVRYLWLNPASDAIEAKYSYVTGGTLNGDHIYIGAGLYESQMQS